MRSGIFRSPAQPQAETTQAASSPLRFPLETLYGCKPCLMVIIGIHYLQTEGTGISGTLILADKIFLVWINVWIAIIYDRLNPFLHQTFHDCARTGSTTCVKEDFPVPEGRL